MESGSGPLDGIRRVFGFPGRNPQRRRGQGEEFAKQLEQERTREDATPKDGAMEQAAAAGDERPEGADRRRDREPRRGRSDDGKGLKVDLLA